MVLLNFILSALAFLSAFLTLWQWLVARRFPLHQRSAHDHFYPAVTILKPLKGADPETKACLESWFNQIYSGPVQLLFGVASAEDSACSIISELCQEHPAADAQLIVCGETLGPNAKVSTLIQLERNVRNEHIVVSDADVRVPPDFLANVIAPLKDPKVGLVNCFYQLANPSTLAMQWEAIAINADFWSQVLQAQSLKPIDFALGAVMGTTRTQLKSVGGFQSLVNLLADDYYLGNKIANLGRRIVICPVVVECWEKEMNWRQVWCHQLRWARTIRFCQPAPFFFSILSNPTLWPIAWLLAARMNGGPGQILGVVVILLLFRIYVALDLQQRLTRKRDYSYGWLVPVKDLLNAVIWTLAFLGNKVEWRGEEFIVRRGGELQKAEAIPPHRA